MSPEKKSSIPCGYVQQSCTTPRKYTTLAILKRGKGWKLTLHKTNLSPHKIGRANPTPNPSFLVNSLLNIDPCKSRRPVKNDQKTWNWLWIPTKVKSFQKKKHRSITPPKFNSSPLKNGGRQAYWDGFMTAENWWPPRLSPLQQLPPARQVKIVCSQKLLLWWTWFNSMCD